MLHNNHSLFSSDSFITVKELSKILNTSQTFTYQLVNRNDFPKIRIGRAIRIPKDEFTVWFENEFSSKEVGNREAI